MGGGWGGGGGGGKGLNYGSRVEGGRQEQCILLWVEFVEKRVSEAQVEE